MLRWRHIVFAPTGTPISSKSCTTSLSISALARAAAVVFPEQLEPAIVSSTPAVCPSPGSRRDREFLSPTVRDPNSSRPTAASAQPATGTRHAHRHAEQGTQGDSPARSAGTASDGIQVAGERAVWNAGPDGSIGCSRGASGRGTHGRVSPQWLIHGPAHPQSPVGDRRPG